MGTHKLTLTFEKITESDIARLTAVMTRAFDDDSQKHLGIERGGPEGYDNGEFFRKWLLGYKESTGYKVMSEGEIIGGVIVWILPLGENRLGTIFVDPAYQDRGVGTRTWQFIETTYPDTKSWSLGTPLWATKNHFFYEQRCGFSRVRETKDEVVYRKEM